MISAKLLWFVAVITQILRSGVRPTATDVREFAKIADVVIKEYLTHPRDW